MIKYPEVDTKLLILPLLMNQLGRPGAFATHLEKLISFSGLFYESHLASWLKGEYPELLLKNEPQSNFFSAAEQRAASFIDLPGLRLRGPEDRMHYMIRQQLELLDSPNLHLAGQLIPGLPVQIWMQQVVLPVDIDEEGASIKSHGPKASGWRVLVRLEHPSFDYVDFSIELVEQNMSIRMTGNSMVLQEYFRRDYEKLSSTFSDLRIEKVTFHRILLSRLEVRPDFKLSITSGSVMRSSSGPTPLENEYGNQAEHIFAQAKNNGMTSHKSHEMLGLLMNLDMDRKIPRQLYSVIEVLTYWVISQINYLSR
jgi:type III secretion system FlhB-like substrate exporter